MNIKNYRIKEYEPHNGDNYFKIQRRILGIWMTFDCLWGSWNYHSTVEDARNRIKNCKLEEIKQTKIYEYKTQEND